MSVHNDDYEQMRGRFWYHLEQRTTASLRGKKNPAAYALFASIDAAFADIHRDFNDSLVPVHHRLVQYLAGWAKDSLEEEQKGGVVGPDANHFLKRAYDGLFQTILGAIKKNQLRHFDDGRIMFGCLELPDWLVDHFIAEAKQEAAWLRKHYDENPGMHLFLIHDEDRVKH